MCACDREDHYRCIGHCILMRITSDNIHHADGLFEVYRASEKKNLKHFYLGRVTLLREPIKANEFPDEKMSWVLYSELWNTMPAK